MSKSTIADTLAAGIVALGGKEIGGRTIKYRVFLYPQENGRNMTLFVGRAGALRADELGKITKSLACGPVFRKRVLAAGEKALGFPQLTGTPDEMLADLE